MHPSPHLHTFVVAHVFHGFAHGFVLREKVDDLASIAMPFPMHPRVKLPNLWNVVECTYEYINNKNSTAHIPLHDIMYHHVLLIPLDSQNPEPTSNWYAWKTAHDWISTTVYPLVRDVVHQLCVSGCFEILHQLSMADNNAYSLFHCVLSMPVKIDMETNHPQ